MAALVISIPVAGSRDPERIGWDEAVKRHRAMEAHARGLEKTAVEAFVKWGSFLHQVKASLAEKVGHGQWLKFLDTSANIKTAQKAMRLAAEAAGEDGGLDVELTQERIQRHDATAADRGVRSLSGRQLSRNVAEIAFGIRGSEPVKRSGAGPFEGVPANVSARRHLRVDPESELMMELGGPARGVLSAECRVPGAGGSIASTVTGPAGAGSAVSHTTAPIGPASGAMTPLGPARSAGDVLGGPGRLRKGRDYVGQMTLEEEFSAATAIGDRIVAQLRAQTMAPELMRRFAEFGRELLGEGGIA